MIGELFLADFARFPAQFLCKLRAYIFKSLLAIFRGLVYRHFV